MPPPNVRLELKADVGAFRQWPLFNHSRDEPMNHCVPGSLGSEEV